MKTKNKTNLILWLILGLTYFAFFGMVIVNIPFTLLGVIVTNDANYILSPIIAEFTSAIYRVLEATIFILLICRIKFKEILIEKYGLAFYLHFLTVPHTIY